MGAIAHLEKHRRLNWEKEEYIPGGGLVYTTGRYDDAFSEGLLQEITYLWNEGMVWEELSEKFNRPKIEMLYALVYLAEEEKLTRPFAYRF